MFLAAPLTVSPGPAHTPRRWPRRKGVTWLFRRTALSELHGVQFLICLLLSFSFEPPFLPGL